MAVIHDLNFEKHPEFLPWLVRKYYHHFFPRFARRADRIATVSEFTKNDIAQRYNVSPDKIDVVYNGANDELHKIIASALAMTYISYFEGFGIPIVEAFYCHVPVITSNVTSMPEVAGDAALMVDPFSVESIRDGMLKLASDENFRQQLINNGEKRKNEFSWQKSSERLWASIEKTLG